MQVAHPLKISLLEGTGAWCSSEAYPHLHWNLSAVCDRHAFIGPRLAVCSFHSVHDWFTNESFIIILVTFY